MTNISRMCSGERRRWSSLAMHAMMEAAAVAFVCLQFFLMCSMHLLAQQRYLELVCIFETLCTQCAGSTEQEPGQGAHVHSMHLFLRLVCTMAALAVDAKEFLALSSFVVTFHDIVQVRHLLATCTLPVPLKSTLKNEHKKVQAHT
jgi:hypothetical protein